MSKEEELRQALLGLLSWTDGGACSDCEMFRAAPSCIEFIHAHDCGHLEDINKALVLLGRPPEEGHHYEDPKAEMQKLAEERVEREAWRSAKSFGVYNQYAGGLELNADNTVMTFTSLEEANRFAQQYNEEDIEGWDTVKYGPCYRVQPLVENKEE